MRSRHVVGLGLLAALAGCGVGGSSASYGSGFDNGTHTPTPSTGSGSGGAVGGGVSTGGGSGSGNGGSGGGTVVQQPPAGQLTAAEWDDLDHWEFFTGLLGGSWGGMMGEWGFHPTARLPIMVRSGGAPVANVPAELRDGQGQRVWAAVTDNGGRAELYAGMFGPSQGPYSAVVGGATLTFPEIPASAAPVIIDLPQATPTAPALDLMFLVDTTGSMGDELSYIQAELEDVVGRVKSNLPAGTRVRLSVDFYRDQGDAYVVRSFPFSEDVATSVAAIAAQSAVGGGDFPEAVDRGLEAAITQHDWSADATARLLFLVLDAPPHDDAATLGRVRAQVAAAAAEGIRIIPVSASGIDKDTEFLLRFFAVATGGTYVFLTDDSGIGNDHLDPSPTIGAFQVELLNDLLVRVIAART